MLACIRTMTGRGFDQRVPCAHFLRGLCRFGDRCNFSHTLSYNPGLNYEDAAASLEHRSSKLGSSYGVPGSAAFDHHSQIVPPLLTFPSPEHRVDENIKHQSMMGKARGPARWQNKGRSDGHAAHRDFQSNTRRWKPCRESKSTSSHKSESFTFMSYNILASNLASEHYRELYWHIPWNILAWPYRKQRLLKELSGLRPQVVCLQEVDHFDELAQDLRDMGYLGRYKRRTGDACDGCAIFWQADSFCLVQEESIEYRQLGLRDNVALLLVLQRHAADSSAGAGPGGKEARDEENRLLVVACVHVLFNPKRGDVKLGQVRVLLERARALSDEHGSAAVVIGGDFNAVPLSSLYSFITDAEVDLSQKDRRDISGQLVGGEGTNVGWGGGSFRRKHDASVRPRLGQGPPEYSSGGSILPPAAAAACAPGLLGQVDCAHTAHASLLVSSTRRELGAGEAGSGNLELHDAVMVPGSTEDVPAMGSGGGGDAVEGGLVRKRCRDGGDAAFMGMAMAENNEKISALVTAAEPPAAAPCTATWRAQEGNERYSSRVQAGAGGYEWDDEELEAATGERGSHVARHPLRLQSAYAQANAPHRSGGGEPQITSFHRRFCGTVDYIWHTQKLAPVRVLDMLPHHTLRRCGGLPSREWPSDHLALVCDFKFVHPSKHTGVQPM
eukprot:jgi/Mesen1/8700/ME000052S08127